MGVPKPFTADMLAERWECSAETVRQLYKRGELRGFRVGRMIRIPLDAVEEYEKSEPHDRKEPKPCQQRTESTATITLRHAQPRNINK